jgi:spermidine synthase
MSAPSLQGLMLPKVIYSTQSEINGQIDVVQVGKTRKLKVGGIEQSLNWDAPSAERLVWGRAVDVLEHNESKLRNILVLGLGGATVQHLIARAFPEVHIVSVDIDPVMRDVAQQYFDLDSIPNHQIIIDDACRVIVEPENFDLAKKSFQAAYVDIFVGSDFPELGKSGNFVAAIKGMVMPSGLVIFNRLYTTDHQDEVNLFIDFIEGFLHDVQTLVVAGYTNSDNVLIYGRV